MGIKVKHPIRRGLWLFLVIFIMAVSCTGRSGKTAGETVAPAAELAGPAKHATTFAPRSYTCYKTGVLTIDGDLSEAAWKEAPWSEPFVDIEGDLKPAPLYRTRVKMLWDSDYLYIGAMLEEPHIWARLRQRDTVIFYDNDFEVFIDPDGDTHGYYEFEMNALNTVWDLLLTMPYRDNGKVLDAWNINGLKSAVKVNGTLNDPSDIDSSWCVELAFPFDVLREWGDLPSDGSTWRINFSRVNWQTRIENGRYTKITDTVTGRPLPEYNWVWSPQGIINMHAPETWGYLHFSSAPVADAASAAEDGAAALPDPDELLKWELRRLYYAQTEYHRLKGRYSGEPDALQSHDGEALHRGISVLLTNDGYEATLDSESSGRRWLIDERGRVYPLVPASRIKN